MSRLRWHERGEPGHAGMLALHRDMLALRRSHPAMQTSAACRAVAVDPDTLALWRTDASGGLLVVVARLRGGGDCRLVSPPDLIPERGWDVILTSEDPPFTGSGSGEARRPGVVLDAGVPIVTFSRPSAIILARR
jgi:hypothetical protein